MKKVLFATTALVASAGIASAQGIEFSGYGEMGVVGGGNFNGGFAAGGVTQFHNDLMLKFSATTETDGGLTVGVSTEIQKAEGNANGAFAADNTAFFISGAFGTLTMGEIDGAVDKRLTENMGNPGTIGDDETIHAGYMGSYADGAYDNQILRYDYDFGAFGVSASVELDDTDTVDDGYAVAMSYDTEMGGIGLGFGLGYQSFETDGTYAPVGVLGVIPAGFESEIIAVDMTADFNNGFVAGIEYSAWNFDNGVVSQDIDHYALSAGYSFDAFSIGANWGQYDVDGIGDISGYGLAVAYDLGGGASIHAGYGDSEWDAVFGPDAGQETWSIGVAMSF
ncbi:outer membrane protein OmpU [Rhodovulum bhavnagarense]|uniref:Outer membrane protein OmpU n=1 Tax=Rhodovulum bhavnagarense TaxID=992286 RepID=A0A4R2RFF0_9RHOB|nr:porin [Rhodovulum bhavnagarense]TCP61613.1 outer membrane protein OmpU [Rhodovulum bhavnagarense]